VIIKSSLNHITEQHRRETLLRCTFVPTDDVAPLSFTPTKSEIITFNTNDKKTRPENSHSSSGAERDLPAAPSTVCRASTEVFATVNISYDPSISNNILKTYICKKIYFVMLTMKLLTHCTALHCSYNMTTKKLTYSFDLWNERQLWYDTRIVQEIPAQCRGQWRYTCKHCSNANMAGPSVFPIIIAHLLSVFNIMRIVTVDVDFNYKVLLEKNSSVHIHAD